MIPRRLEIPKELPKGTAPEPTISPENARYVRLYLERVAIKLDRLANERTGSYRTVLWFAARILRDAKPD